MANKLTPRKVTVGTGATLLTDRQKRRSVVFMYTGSVGVALHNRSTVVAYGDAFPIPADVAWTDTVSKDDYYAIAESGTVDVWVWEVE